MTTRIQTEMKQRTTENCHLLELLAESNSLLGQRSLTMEALQEETLDLKEQLRVLRQEKRSIEDELHTSKSPLTGPSYFLHLANHLKNWKRSDVAKF